MHRLLQCIYVHKIVCFYSQILDSCPVPQVTPLADANKAEPSTAVVRCVEFHPNGQLLLTAGLDKRLRLFQVEYVFRMQMMCRAFRMRC